MLWRIGLSLGLGERINCRRIHCDGVDSFVDILSVDQYGEGEEKTKGVDIWNHELNVLIIKKYFLLISHIIF